MATCWMQARLPGKIDAESARVGDGGARTMKHFTSVHVARSNCGEALSILLHPKTHRLRGSVWPRGPKPLVGPGNG